MKILPRRLRVYVTEGTKGERIRVRMSKNDVYMQNSVASDFVSLIARTSEQVGGVKLNEKERLLFS